MAPDVALHQLPQLEAVSCPDASWCMAVGYSKHVDARWPNGTDRWPAASAVEQHGRWRVVPVPDPAHTTDTVLQSVTCTGPSRCLAVGFSGQSTTGGTPFATVWNGHRWRTSLGGDAGRFGYSNGGGGLIAVSCSTDSDCMAVGAGRAITDPISAFWNGRNWTTRPMQTTRGGFQNAFIAQGVACPTVTRCLAAGRFPPTTQQTAAQVWNGRRWSFTSTPPLRQQVYMMGIACVSAERCEIAGWLNSPRESVLMPWTGQRWGPATVLKAERPVTAIGLSDVACSGGTCVAVGSAQIGSQPVHQDIRAVTAIDTGHGWRGGIAIARGPRMTTLTGISCFAPGHCVAVGTAGDGEHSVIASI